VDSVLGGDSPYTYSLDGISFNPNNELCGLGPGDYTVYVKDVNGCEGQIDLNIPEPEELTLDIGGNLLIEYGDTATITAVFNLPPEEIEEIIWEPEVIPGPDPFTVFFYTLEQQTVSATLVAKDGCTAEDVVFIYVSREIDVYAPNAFTPNGDEYNSFFTLYGNEDEVLGIDVLRIYSRWGEQVFERENIPINDESAGWDGTFRGEDMPPAVYGFYAEVTLFDGSKKFLKGDLTLIRQQ
jgi:gliding motility-associated-like protein